MVGVKLSGPMVSLEDINIFQVPPHLSAPTMTHSDKVIQQQSRTWPYGLECWGHDPVIKNLLNLCTLRSLVALCTRQCTESNGEMESTGVCCDKFF